MDRRLVRELLLLFAAKAVVLTGIYFALFAPYRDDPAPHVAALFSSAPAR